MCLINLKASENVEKYRTKSILFRFSIVLFGVTLTKKVINNKIYVILSD